jgi:hypothetical protein
MKTMLSSRVRGYMKRLGIFLIMVALITGIGSCDGASCGYSPVEWDLNTSSGEGGHVIVSGGPRFADGTVVMIEAVADECYEFVSWTGDVADPYSAITTVTMDKAQSVTANFALLIYDLTTDSTDGGTVTSPVEDTFTYDCGTVVDLVAEAAPGYHFVEWTGDIGTIADVNAAETTITMEDDYSITANFESEEIPPLQYDLTVSSSAGGSVTDPGEGEFTYDEGAVVELVAMADSGYYFVEWTGDVSTVADVDDATTDITMNGDYSITANFAVTLFQAVHFGQNQGNWNVGLWKYYGNGTKDGAVNHAGNGAVRWDDGSQGTDQGLTHNFTLTYDPTTYTLSFQVTGGSKTVLETATSPVVPPAAPGPVNNLYMVIKATAGTLVQCANQASMPKQQVDYSKTTVSNLTLDGMPLAGIEVEAKLVDNPGSTEFTNTAELDIPVPTGVAWTLTGNISVAFVAANMACPPKQWRIGMPQLDGQCV